MNQVLTIRTGLRVVDLYLHVGITDADTYTSLDFTIDSILQPYAGLYFTF